VAEQVDTVASLTVVFVESSATQFGRRVEAAARALRLHAQHRGRVLRHDEYETGRGVCRCAAPVSAAIVAGHLNCVAKPRRRKQPFIAGISNPGFDAGQLLRIRNEWIHFCNGEILTRKWRWLGREWLCRRRMLSWHMRLWNRTLFDRPQWLTCHAIKYVQETLLGGLRDGIYLLAVVIHCDQLW